MADCSDVRRGGAGERGECHLVGTGSALDTIAHHGVEVWAHGLEHGDERRAIPTNAGMSALP